MQNTTPSLFMSEQPRTGLDSRPHRYTLCLTLRCNLACTYCYVRKNPLTMPLSIARRSLDFIFRHAPAGSNIEIGFFGGEPLLEFPLLKDIVSLIESHPAYDPARVSLTITTNGTIFSEDIAGFLKNHSFKVCISCDGPPQVQNLFRRTADGKDTSEAVERTIGAALEALPTVLVNAVYHPQTFGYLPQTLDYLAALGVRHIFLNPDFSAKWTQRDVDGLPAVYRAVADRYIGWYLNGTPRFVSLIDTKIAVLVRGGYHPSERCNMGIGEIAITPDGSLYPCERLIGDGTATTHRIGSIEHGPDLSLSSRRCASGGQINPECLDCSLKDYCMNWCGCSNSFMTGYYNRVGPFLCASEKAAIQIALDVFAQLESRLGPVFLHHLSGLAQVNSQLARKGDTA